MAIREMAVESFDIVSGAGVCNDLYTGFGAGVGGAIGSAGGPAGTIIGGTIGGAIGGWIGRNMCSGD